MSHPPQDEEAIFHVAKAIEDDNVRSTYLQQVCANDSALRDRVEALLAANEDQRFLSDAEPQEGADDDFIKSEGRLIGRYKLLQKIGEGGFGVVYMAEQTHPVHRKVALKVIKAGMDTKAVVARFEAERQALSLMDHPNICRVLDGGESDQGRPYFVMDLVKGIPVTEFCDQNQLPTSERLRLFSSICLAVHHAHQKGIIHRDLKPSNILVTLHDGKPVVKVIDFGVAKAINQRLTEKTLFTAFGQMIGTPQYMSPEQAEMSGLDIDTRSDIYSLGVILYELLTGTLPLEKEALVVAGFMEIRRLIQESEPPKPSSRLTFFSTSKDELSAIADLRGETPDRLWRMVRGDLDWIVMKALEKDRSRRYESASAFQEDVERFLERKAISARPPSMAYQLRKTLQRHWISALFAMILFAGLSIGLTGAIIGWVQAQNANKRWYDSFLALMLEGQPKSLKGFTDRLRNRPERSKFLVDLHDKLALSSSDGERIRAATALSFLGENQSEFLIKSIANVTHEEYLSIVDSLRYSEPDAGHKLSAAIAKDTDAKTAVRLALGGLALDDSGGIEMVTRAAVDPVYRMEFIRSFGIYYSLVDVDVLCAYLKDGCMPDAVSGICNAIGTADPDNFAPERREELIEALQELAQQSPFGSVHTAALWALSRWSVEFEVRAEESDESADWFVNKTGITMLRLAAGQFQKGIAERPNIKEKDDIPLGQELVSIPHDFYMSAYEITVRQYRQYMESESYPEGSKNMASGMTMEMISPGDDYPANHVSWNDAVLYCNWLSRQEGRTPCYTRTGEFFDGKFYGDEKWEKIDCDFSADGYRLPTDSEWEYACRANTQSLYYFGNDPDDLHQYAAQVRGRAAPVGSYMPNPWGFSDMAGNVYEWCWDLNPKKGFSDFDRVFRGGGFPSLDILMCMSGYSAGNNFILYRGPAHGLRVVCARASTQQAQHEASSIQTEHTNAQHAP